MIAVICPDSAYAEYVEQVLEARRRVAHVWNMAWTSADDADAISDVNETVLAEEEEGWLSGDSLALSAAAASGEREGLNELLMRARSHDRDHLDIPPHLYALWQEAVVATARARDPEWDARVETAWRAITGFMIEFMSSRY